MATLGQIPSKTRLTTSLAATTTVLPRLHDTQPAVLLYSSQADPNPQAQGCSLLNVAPKAPHAVRQRSALSEPSTLFNSSMLVTGTPPRGLSGPWPQQKQTPSLRGRGHGRAVSMYCHTRDTTGPIARAGMVSVSFLGLKRTHMHRRHGHSPH